MSQKFDIKAVHLGSLQRRTWRSQHSSCRTTPDFHKTTRKRGFAVIELWSSTELLAALKHSPRVQRKENIALT